MGHPETRNLRDDIIQLLTNQILFGTEEDEEDPEAPKKLEKKNFEMQLAKMDLFFKETEEKKEQIKVPGEDFTRAFFVLESQLTYELDKAFTGKQKEELNAIAHMILHKVLIGKQNSIEE